MTAKQPYPEEFKIEAVKQVTERGHTVADVSSRLGVSAHSLYKSVNEARQPADVRHGRRRRSEAATDAGQLRAPVNRARGASHGNPQDANDLHRRGIPRP